MSWVPEVTVVDTQEKRTYVVKTSAVIHDERVPYSPLPPVPSLELYVIVGMLNT